MPIEPEFDVSDLSDYEIHSRREIMSILRHLIDSKQLVQLQLKDMASSAVTSFLDLDDASGSLILDCAQEAHINQRVLESRHIAFETRLDNIRVLFEVDSARRCEYQGTAALQVAIPPMLIRLQRREFYRVPTPVVNPLLCSIHIPDGESSRVVTLPLANISGGGVALMDEQKLLNPSPGFIYHDCRIALPAGTRVLTALEIRNQRDVTFANGKTTRRVGCRFVQLSAATLNVVQRYITNLERELNAKNTGLS